MLLSPSSTVAIFSKVIDLCAMEITDMSQPGLRDSKDLSGKEESSREEELCVASFESTEADHQEKELHACQDLHPTTGAEPQCTSPGRTPPAFF